MASIRKQKAGTWRVQVRRKGRSVSENFVRYEDAKRWAIDAERQIDRGEAPMVSRVSKLKTFGDLIDLHISDMSEVGKAPRRSKDATLKMLKRELGARFRATSCAQPLEARRECATAALPAQVLHHVWTARPADFHPMRCTTPSARTDLADRSAPVHMAACAEVHMRTVAVISQKGGGLEDGSHSHDGYVASGGADTTGEVPAAGQPMSQRDRARR